MTRIPALIAALVVALAGCAPTAPITEDGTGGAGVYRISAQDAAQIQFRMLDSVNALRGAAGARALQLSAQLNAAAAVHSRDMAAQNRPWHFGSDGSSPLQRVQRAGYLGELKGENISETFETELETLAAWMEQPDTRRVILARDARDLGVAWHQEANGKIWWTLITGGPASKPSPQSSFAPLIGIEDAG
ncbi:MAG: CAP domain-containing protein [Pseudomonadota bacterium]